MRKLIKSLLLFPLVLILAAVIFVFSIDPTRLAPIIQEQLANQGIDARFNGKISWQLYPNIGLSINDLELHSLNAKENNQLPRLASLGKVSFSVELQPLFSRQIRINGIELTDATVHLYIDKSGHSNWQSPPQQNKATEEQTTGGNKDLPSFGIKTIEVVNLQLLFEDESTDTRAEITQFNLNSSDLNLAGEVFPLSMNFALSLNRQPTINTDLVVNMSYNLESGALALKNINTHLSGKQIDDTRISGSLSYLQKNSTMEVPADLQIDRLNIDKLLALLGSNDNDIPTPAEPTALPLALIRTLESKFKLHVATLEGFGVTLKNLAIKIDAKDGYINIQELNAAAFNGEVRSLGFFDARPDNAILKLTGKADNIDIGKLVKQFANNENLAGTTNTEFSVNSQGRTSDDLINGLNAEAVTQAKSLVLQPLNIEKQYCKLVSLLNKESTAAQLLSASTWQAFTTMEPVEVKIKYAQNQVQLEKLSAKISSLLTSATGVFDLQSGKFDFPLSLSLQSLEKDNLSCMDISKHWVNHSLPLRCKGKLNKIGIDTCLPDTNLMKDILGAKFKTEINEKLDAEKARLQEKVDAEKARTKAKLDEEKLQAEEKAKKKLDNKVNKLIEKL